MALIVQFMDEENNVIPIEEFDQINIAIYTLDEQIAVIKEKKDIVNGQLIIEGNELSKLPTGVINVCYQLSVLNPDFPDGKMDTVAHEQTNYLLTDCRRI